MAAPSEIAVGSDPASGTMVPGLPSAPTGSGFAASPPPKPAKSPGRWKAWVVVGVTVAIVLGAVGYTAFGNSGSKTVVLLKNGTGIEIPAGDYYTGALSLSKSATLSGSLVSGDGVVAYVMNPSTYEVFHATGRTSGSTWSSQVMFNSTFSVYLGPGSWQVVFEAPNPNLPTEFLMTSNLAATTAP